MLSVCMRICALGRRRQPHNHYRHRRHCRRRPSHIAVVRVPTHSYKYINRITFLPICSTISNCILYGWRQRLKVLPFAAHCRLTTCYFRFSIYFLFLRC